MRGINGNFTLFSFKRFFPPKFSEKESISFYVVVLVDSDGVEQISFRFGHKRQCLTFLFAVENGLAPLFRIQPPLETIKGIEGFFQFLR